MEQVDLHVHTTASDGTLSPTQVVELAAELGLGAIAITDHDTVAGVEEAQAAGARLGVEVLAGMEISTQWRGREIHLLGYLLDTGSPALKPALEWTVRDRNARNERIAAMLQRDGYSVTMERIAAISGGGVIGRPHMAQALLEAGAVASVQEAFDRLLGEGCPYFLPRSYIPFSQAAELIRQAEGVAVLAHPLQYGFDPATLEEFVQGAAELGVDGLEVWYSGYTGEESRLLMALGRARGMIFTGGSDFHGTRKPNIHLGFGKGGLCVGKGAVEALRERKIAKFQKIFMKP